LSFTDLRKQALTKVSSGFKSVGLLVRAHWARITLLVLVVCVSWLVTTGLLAARELSAARSEISTLVGVNALDRPVVLADTLGNSRMHSNKAHKLVTGPIWWLSSEIPMLGNSPKAVRAVTASLDQILGSTTELESELRNIQISGNEVINPQLATVIGKSMATLSDPVNDSLHRLDGLSYSLVPKAISAPALQLTNQLVIVQPYLIEGPSFAKAIPALLGIDKPREWLLVFENGAEARATGGFPGGLGLLTASNGKLSLANLESNDAVMAQPLTDVSSLVPQDAMDLYGSDLSRLSDMNLSPDFPFNAKLMWSNYKQNEGVAPDGLISMDEHALASLMRVTGPVSIDGYKITNENAVAYVTRVVYEKYPDYKKKDIALLKLVKGVFAKLSEGSGPLELTKTLLPAIRDGRIKAWVADPQLEEIFTSSRLGGSMADFKKPTHAVVLINGAGNKIDAYVQSNVTYTVGQCTPYLPYRDSIMRVTLNNSAPTSGLPEYVSQRNDRGQLRPDDPGSTKMLAYLHVPLGAELQTATVDGVDVPLISEGMENNRTVWRLDVELPANSIKNLIVTFSEPAIGDEPSPILWTQPMSLPMVTSVIPGPPCGLEKSDKTP
jgi:hypothetical protein